jgi:uncharacterized repeat protein (TIGR03803 family)
MNPIQNAFSTKWPMAIFVVVMILAGGVLAVAQTENVIYRFQGGTDGAAPWGGLISDHAGNFYGTTAESVGGGTIFELSPPAQQGGPWTKTTLYQFTGRSDGGFPIGEMVFDQAGNLFGITTDGGTGGDGTVFELSPQGATWSETVIYNFPANASPSDGLVFDKAGNLYGATSKGGEKNAGAVFELTPSQGGGWTESVIYSFGVRRNSLTTPSSGPIFSRAGNLYGLLLSGNGGVYELKAPATQGGAWTERELYTFQGGGDGASPLGRLAFDQKLNLDGTTKFGGTHGAGTVFQLTRQGAVWTESVLYSFCSQPRCSDGLSPKAGLILDGKGNLYGTTYFGGKGRGSRMGTIFQLTPPASQGGVWTESVVHGFGFKAGGDGAFPVAPLAHGQSGSLWGTTSAGGVGNNGTVFRIWP